jgi:hypothetical protein
VLPAYASGLLRKTNPGFCGVCVKGGAGPVKGVGAEVGIGNDTDTGKGIGIGTGPRRGVLGDVKLVLVFMFSGTGVAISSLDSVLVSPATIPARSRPIFRAASKRCSDRASERRVVGFPVFILTVRVGLRWERR